MQQHHEWFMLERYQDDAFWYITRSYERSCRALEQNKNKFYFWPLHSRIFRIAHGYLLHFLIFPHPLRMFKDFGMHITNTGVFAKIFIVQKWVLIPIWWMSHLAQIVVCITFAWNYANFNSNDYYFMKTIHMIKSQSYAHKLSPYQYHDATALWTTDHNRWSEFANMDNWRCWALQQPRVW